MNTKRQLTIDEYIVRPAVNVLNVFVILLGKLLSIDHSLNHSGIKTIAICKYKGLGSIIQTTPLLKNLKKIYPNAKIVFITTPGNKYIIEKTGLVEQVICLNDKSFFTLFFQFPKFVLQLIKLKISIYIDLEVYSNFSTLVTILSLAKNRLGFYLQSKHYRLGNYTHMMYHNTQSPISESYMQFARLCDKNITPEPLASLGSNIQTVSINNKTLDLIKTNYIVINPNASDLRLERRWGKENFRNLISQLVDKTNTYKIVVIGGKNEEKYVNHLLSKINNSEIINTAGKTNLEELIAIIQNAKLIISNDSGPMHIAFATNTPSVGLFGPCSPVQYGNYTTSISIYKNVYCSPCVHDFVNPPCRGNNMCMKLISVDEVLNAILSFIDEKSYNQPNNKIIYQTSDFVLGTLNRKH